MFRALIAADLAQKGMAIMEEGTCMGMGSTGSSMGARIMVQEPARQANCSKKAPFVTGSK